MVGNTTLTLQMMNHHLHRLYQFEKQYNCYISILLSIKKLVYILLAYDKIAKFGRKIFPVQIIGEYLVECMHIHTLG